jgi:HSP20 family protein
MNRLTVSGERKEQKEEQGNTFHRVERRTATFSRSVLPPCAVDENKIDAQCRDGVLAVNLPKADQAKAKRIQVKPG